MRQDSARADIAAVIVAAGRGARAGGAVAKQWQMLAGRPVLAHTIDAFRRAAIAPIIVVVAPEDTARAATLAGNDARVVPGGDTRRASVRAALEALAAQPPHGVLIHDGARPLVSTALIGRMAAALGTQDAAAPALAVTDALWRGANGRVMAAVPRDGLYRAQTPQAFRFHAILAAHRGFDAGTGPEPADDVEMARTAGLDVAILPGEEDNIKLTWPGDLARAARLLEGRPMDIRSGSGFDVHRFGPGDAVVLCGVRIPFDRGLDGHSDADVGMHALTDAIYGALAEGDIGRHFPPSDPQWKGADSALFLRHAAGRIAARGYRLANADVTLICEAPKIGPHADAMAARLAEILGVEPGRIGVKATTTERLGFTGRGEGIAAMASATLVAR